MGVEMCQQPPNPPGILGGHDIHGAEQLAGPQCEVTQIAERCRDDVQRGGHGGKVAEGGNGERLRVIARSRPERSDWEERSRAKRSLARIDVGSVAGTTGDTCPWEGQRESLADR